MIVGLFLQVGTAFAFEGPTRADILAGKLFAMRVGPKVQVAAEGSLEDQLISAVKDNDVNNVERLIAAGANLEAGDREDFSNLNALMIAATKGYTDIATKLINAGANVKAETRQGISVFTFAIHNGHAAIVKLLVAKGAAKNQRNFGYHFEYAVAIGNDEMVQALLADELDIDDETLKRACSEAKNRCSVEVFSAIKERIKKSRS